MAGTAGIAYVGVLERVGDALGEPWDDPSYRRVPIRHLRFALHRAGRLAVESVEEVAFSFARTHHIMHAAIFAEARGGAPRWIFRGEADVPAGCGYAILPGDLVLAMLTNLDDCAPGGEAAHAP